MGEWTISIGSLFHEMESLTEKAAFLWSKRKVQWKPHLGLQHIPRPPWLVTGGIFETPAERDVRGHGFKLRHRSFRLLRRKAVSSVRLPVSWNKLLMKIVNSFTLNTFKRLLDLVWFSLFPSLPWLPCSFNVYHAWFEAPNRKACKQRPWHTWTTTLEDCGTGTGLPGSRTVEVGLSIYS